MKFSQLYLTALYDRSQRGGTQAQMDSVLIEINNPTAVGLAFYLAALSPPSIPCGSCGDAFDVSLITPQPKLETDVLCTNCPIPVSS